IHTMGEIGDSGYKDPLLFFMSNTKDTSYIEAAITSLGRLKGEKDRELYKTLYQKYSSPILRSIILDNLIKEIDLYNNDSDLTGLFHSIIENRNDEDMTLLMIAMTGLSKIGNETDIRLLENIFDGSHDVYLKEHIISTISNFNRDYVSSIKTALQNIWDKETEDSVRIIAGCKLFLAGEHILFPLLIERLSIIDEHFERFIQQSFFVMNKDSVLEIFRTLLRNPGPYPEAELTRRTLQHIVLHSANREFASIAMTILGSRFGETEEMQSWFYELVSTANRPELRGLAILSLKEIPHGNFLDFLEERIFSSNWPATQKFALYALGLQDLEETDHSFRIQLLDRFIRESKSYDLFDHALWVYYACGRTTDYDNLHQLIYDEHSMNIRNNYYIQQIENIIDHIQERSHQERALPDLADLYKMENYGWRQSLRLNPMIFSF
ncbi:MAG: hypothetical protein JXJ04_22710, partial [Spirochaetales bacterium]|nr:hypothetical protein [Spirochaetales bacterium]